MYPELFNIGPLTIHTYGVFFALGIIAAVVFAEYLNKRGGGNPGAFSDLAVLTLVGVIIGARSLFVLVNLKYFANHPLEIPMIWRGGLVFYGGLIGGAVAFIVAARILKMDLLKSADTVAPAVALGHGIGRIGCFFAGSCYGKPTDLPWAVVFTDPRSLAQGVLGTPVHPVQIYSSLSLMALAVVLIRIRKVSRFEGQVIASYGVLYGLLRFGMEFLRGDPRGFLAISGVTLSTSQVISLVVVPLSVAAWAILSRRSTSQGFDGLQVGANSV